MLWPIKFGLTPPASSPKIVHESSKNIIQDGELKEVQGLDHLCFSTCMYHFSWVTMYSKSGVAWIIIMNEQVQNKKWGSHCIYLAKLKDNFHIHHYLHITFSFDTLYHIQYVQEDYFIYRVFVTSWWLTCHTKYSKISGLWTLKRYQSSIISMKWKNTAAFVST
jgi:hypothetical protein